MEKRVPIKYTKRKSIKTSSGVLRSIQVADIVILRNDSTACCLWKLARVTETINRRDGAVRAARVQLMSKNKVIILRHPIQHLIHLEADS